MPTKSDEGRNRRMMEMEEAKEVKSCPSVHGREEMPNLQFLPDFVPISRFLPTLILLTETLPHTLVTQLFNHRRTLHRTSLECIDCRTPQICSSCC